MIISVSSFMSKKMGFRLSENLTCILFAVAATGRVRIFFRSVLLAQEPSFGVFERPIWFQRLAHNELVCMCFTGRSALHLWNQLSSRMGFEPDPNSTMCVRAGTYGRLTPLVTDLPGNNSAMVIFVLPPESLAGFGLTCPNVHAA
uniref:DUF569 domain-containing protein n=1 Tax=Oryza rufipogon TaxID=4529 RepID=A0A0E0PU30_ORYRU